MQKQTEIVKVGAQPEGITAAFLEVVIMPNGELISKGKTIGWFDGFSEFIHVRK